MNLLRYKPVLVVGGLFLLALISAITRVMILPGVDIAGVHYKVFGDTFWLIRNVFLFTGSNVEEATRRGLEVFLPLANGPIPDLTAAVNEKMNVYLAISPRYTAIFESRPFGSLVLAPFLLTFGPSSISWVIAIEVAIAGFIAVLVAAQISGTTITKNPALGVLVLIAFFALPTGEWGSAILFEGFSYIFAGLIVLLALKTLDGAAQKTFALWLIGPASILGLAAKSSVITPVIIVVTLAFAWRVISSKGKDRIAIISTSITLAALALWSFFGWVFKWPGVMDSLQDTFTDHFNRPDVSNPIQLWVQLLKSSTKGELLWAIDNPAIPLAFILVLIFSVKRFGFSSLFLFAFVVSGLANFFIHPEPSEFERFFAIAWLAAVVAVPVFLQDSWIHYKEKRSGFTTW